MFDDKYSIKIGLHVVKDSIFYFNLLQLLALGLSFGRVKNVLLLKAKKLHEPTQVRSELIFIYVEWNFDTRKCWELMYNMGSSLKANKAMYVII